MSALTLRFDDPAHLLVLRGQRAGFVLLAALLLSFLLIRTSARLRRSPRIRWWPGSVTTASGIHLHHLVWGIGLLMTTGFLDFVTRPSGAWSEVLAGAFGVGAGLTLDEFALWIHLRDVYWAEEGRSSLDAVVVATLIGGLLVVGVAPFDLPNNTASVSAVLGAGITDVGLAALAIVKGRRLLGMIGIFLPIVSVIGAVRLASPRSPWARRLYDPDGRKLARAQARWQRSEARRRQIADAIVGAPGHAAGVDPRPAKRAIPGAAAGGTRTSAEAEPVYD